MLRLIAGSATCVQMALPDGENPSMIAPFEEPPQPDEKRFGANQVLGVAFGFVVPVYLALALLVQTFFGKEAVVTETRRFLFFAGFSAVGLAMAVVSVWVRNVVERRGGEALKSLLVGLALAECAAFLGLIYFILFRDWFGFAMLVCATLASFAYHAKHATPEERTS